MGDGYDVDRWYESQRQRMAKLEGEHDKYKAQSERLFKAFLELSGCPYCEGIGDLCAEHVPTEQDDEEECECCDDCGWIGASGHCDHCGYLDET